MNSDNLKPVFYIIAHPDDWQIFCGQQVFIDINTPGIKVVFIHMSSGDADNDLGKQWNLREKASAYSCQVLTPGTVSEPEERSIRGHKVIRYNCGKTISYFLRVREVELNVLTSSAPNVISTVDGCSTYVNVDDLKSTLYTIINSELSNYDIRDIWINTHECDHSFKDHDGHNRATGDIINELFTSSNILFFRGYDIASMPINLCNNEIYLKRALLLAYSNKIYEETQKFGVPICDYSIHKSCYEPWLARYYPRQKNIVNMVS